MAQSSEEERAFMVPTRDGLLLEARISLPPQVGALLGGDGGHGESSSSATAFSAETRSSTCVVVAHPYGPLGGNLHNNVVSACCQLFVSMGFITARFNFRGVGTRDNFTSLRTFEDLVAALPNPKRVETFVGADHFWFGGEDEVVEAKQGRNRGKVLPQEGPRDTPPSSGDHILKSRHFSPSSSSADPDDTRAHAKWQHQHPKAPPPTPAAAPEQPLPVYMNVAAGAIAGVTEIIVCYPLDVVKTRFQLQVKGAAGGYRSIGDAFAKIVRQEGPGALYRGILPPIMVEAPKRAIKFSANEEYGKVFRALGVKDQQLASILTGMSAGATESLVVVSPDLVKIRLQDKANAGKYKGTADAFAKIFREEGFGGFWKGLEATALRHILWNAGYFGVIQAVRSRLPKANTRNEKLTNNFIAGTIGGTVGTILNTPFDVVKSRVQGQITGTKYNWAIPAIGTIAREEGLSALYKGFVPKVLRLGPGGGILLATFEIVTGYMRANFL
ncbi:hypothetical protein HK405_004201 [Cladochytrium tenue]|nr:hypothetical protein HK405_004201 [Cladochytrium tenue]